MTPDEQANMKRWVETWKRAGPELERIREEEVRKEQGMESFDVFTGMALEYIRDHPPEPYSGLVEQQRWFRLLAARNDQHE